MPDATAVWFPRARTVELRTEELPALGPHDVLVQAIASAISHGTEMLVYRGQVPPELELDLPTLRGSFDFPIKYGYASVGRVMDVGSAVDALAAGDVVFVHHPHQSQFVVPDSMPVPLPRDLDPELGVFLANVETALNVVLDAAPRIGERVAVFGQGVVGLLITQLLRRTGVDCLIVVDPIERRRHLATSLGASAAVDPRDFTASAAVDPRDFTASAAVDPRDFAAESFDLAIEASGHPSALGQAIDCLAFGGTVVVCSWYGTKPVSIPLGGAFHRRRLRLVSSQVSTIDASLQPRWTHARRLLAARDLLTQLELKPLISHRFALDRAAEAYALVDTASEQTVQVVLTY